MGVPTPTSGQGSEHLRVIREAILRAADPARAVEAHWPRPVPPTSPARLLVIGKAAVPMAREAIRLLLAQGGKPGAALVVTTPHPEAVTLARELGVEVLVADHPLATERNLEAARRVADFVAAAAPDHTLLLLLSGGGSALLTWPAGGLTLDDLRQATHDLLRAGAPIRELNCVRKHCERLKGGRLACLIPPGVRTHALIVSDVLGDPLDVISSGPISPDPTTYADALAVLERRGLTGSLSRITAHLARGLRGEIDETPKPGSPAFALVRPRVIAGNQQAALAARDAALSLGFSRVMLVCRVQGEASDVGRALVREALEHHAESPHAASAVIFAGETTVTVGDAPGLGGRNQELALAAAVALAPSGKPPGSSTPRTMVMTLATDGIDGPTDAAGAIVSDHTDAQARRQRLSLVDALASHDSHRALDALACLIRTGPTGTNVNDVAVALVYPD